MFDDRNQLIADIYSRNIRAHGDLRDLDARMLHDIGLVRTDAGDLALSDDPSRVIAPPSHPRTASALLRRLSDWIPWSLLHLARGSHHLREDRTSTCTR